MAAQRTAQTHLDPPASLGLVIIENGGYPELHVDGKPFFIHSATFYYYRIPRDLWEKSLDAHRALGINTIHLPIPWNWHELRQGEFDFDGRSNPRRDLRSLLKLIQEKGFRLTVQAGPVVDHDWRHGGYPAWLLERPEFEVDARARRPGHDPPFLELAAQDPESAARTCLDNATHISYTRKWLARVAQELAPYSIHRTLRRTVPAEKKKQGPIEIEESGPLLLVHLDTGLALPPRTPAGAFLRQYADELRAALAAGGLDVPVFVRSQMLAAYPWGSTTENPIRVAGQWYLPEASTPRRDGDPPLRFAPGNAVDVAFLAAILNTQQAFPPLLADYRAAWPAPTEDERPRVAAPENALLSSRLFLAHGLAGINYAPLQDSLTPAGYEAPDSNRFHRFDAALDINANPQPGARTIRRTGQLLPLWGELLGSSHQRADFAVVYPLRTLPQTSVLPEDVQRAAEAVQKLQRLAAAAGLAVELLDVHHQPVEHLLRHPLILLPVLAPVTEEKFRLSEPAQRALVEYVRQGGMLAYYPQRPLGGVLTELWTGHPIPADGVIRTAWTLGLGKVIELESDPVAAVNLADSLSATRTQAEAAGAIAALHQLLTLAGAQPAVERSGPGSEAEDLIIAERVSNSGTRRLGDRSAGWGLLSVTNLAAEGNSETELSVLSPRAGARGGKGERLRLPVTVPAGESLLLPLHYPLCAEAPPRKKCADEVTIAGAELLSAYRDGKTLELLFYAPARATAVFRLAEQPRRVHVDEMSPEGTWTEESRQFRTEILRGAAPDYLRTVRIDLRYEPFLPKKPDPRRQFRRGFDFAVTDAARLPLASDAALVTFPPLLFLDADRTGRMIVEAQNHDELGARLDVKVDGPVRGSELLILEAAELGHERVNLKPADNVTASAAGNDVLTAELRLKGFGDEKISPVAFVPVRTEGATTYQFDFDRDGAQEWVLENTGLRALLSPEAGGRVVALVNKQNGLSLTNSVGLLRDQFMSSGDLVNLADPAYRAEWVTRENDTDLRLSYSARNDDPPAARIEKTIRLLPGDGSLPGVLEAHYRVELTSRNDEAKDPLTFKVTNSIPALLRGGRTTRFCWQPGREPAEGSDAAETCESFQPGSTLTLPEGVRSLAVRTPGGHMLLFEWSAGALSVDMKNYSALLQVAFPPLGPGGASAEYAIRFLVREE